MLKNIIWIILLSLFLVVCNKEQTEVIAPKPHSIAPAEKTMIDESNQLGFDCFNKLIACNFSGDNLIISPINSFLSFNLLLQASNEQTKREIKQFLHISHLKDENIINGFDNLNKLFSNIDANTNINGQNKLAVHPNINVNDEFAGFLNKRSYTGILKDENAGFIDNIKSIQGSGEAVFQMINSIDFSAQIKYQTRIEESPFYSTPDESNFVKMSVAEAAFNYYSDASLQAVEMPLGRGNYNILFIVPRGSQTINGLTDNLDNRLLKRMQSKFKQRQLEVYLPLIELSGVETFREVFAASRLSNCFNEKRADFSKLSSEKSLYLSDFEQISNFKINQEQLGGSNFNTKTAKESFLIDKPFLFIVYEKYSEGIIFIGKISKL